MGSATTTKGQARIPKAIREYLGVKPGDRISFFLHPNGSVVILQKLPASALRGMLKTLRPPVTIEEMGEAIASGASESALRRKRRRSGSIATSSSATSFRRSRSITDGDRNHRARLIGKNQGFIGVVAMAETVWVLDRAHRFADEDIVAAIEHRLQTDVLVVEREQEVFAAMIALKEARGTVTDALIGALGTKAGCSRHACLRQEGFAASPIRSRVTHPPSGTGP